MLSDELLEFSTSMKAAGADVNNQYQTPEVQHNYLYTMYQASGASVQAPRHGAARGLAASSHACRHACMHFSGPHLHLSA